MKDIIDDVKVIYREDDYGLEIENIIFEKILKKGVWVLYGKKDGIYECLNVGKSINVGSEILYDIACLKFLGYEENSNAHLKYINQFAEFKDFNYKSKMTQEYLYPYISKTYKEHHLKILEKISIKKIKKESFKISLLILSIRKILIQ